MKRSAVQHIWRKDRWVKPFFLRYRKTLALALGLGLLTFIFAGGLMFTSGYLISTAASIPESVLVLDIPLIFVRIFGIGKPILHYFERLASHDWVLRMTSRLRLLLYRSLEKDALFFKATHRTGDILGLLAEDIGHLQNLYLRTIFPTVVAWLVWFVIVVFAGFFSAFLVVLFLLMLGIIIVVAPLISVMVCGARRMRAKVLRNELYAELTDNVLGVADWVFSQRGDEYRLRYKKAEADMKALEYSEARFARLRDFVLQVLFGVTITGLVIWAASSLAGGSAGQSNWIAAAILGFFPLIDAFVPLSSAAVDALSYRDSLIRLNDLPEPVEDTQQDKVKPTHPLDIILQGVSYTYPQTTRRILDQVNLVIPEGQKIALLGRSGAGKTTLATLIRGDIAPCEGQVFLGGIDTSSFGDEISAYIGVIQQNTYLFNLSLRENLRIGRRDASDEEIEKVLEQVGLRSMYERLPHGLNTLADEAGLRFSGGERHRIALARVLLQNTPVVILDEPGVGLDPLTEQSLLKTLFSTLKDRTLIMITHHLVGASLCDRVVFFEKGQVILDGSPGTLQQESTRYRRLLAFDRGEDALMSMIDQ